MISCVDANGQSHILSAASSDSFICIVGLPYSLLSRLGDVLVGFEEGSQVHCLAAPEMSVDGPVEGEFEGAAVEGAVGSVC